MDPASLRIEFEKQLKESDTKIAQAEEQLAKLKEYRLKLQGGMETIDLLSPKTEEQVATSDGPPEPTTPAPEE
tara:strand:+ start:1095 stop:1313 length:219 start_codon:yes stop_codon:yes gene_type:complete